MKQLSDFDLSIVMPFYKCLDKFKRVFASKAKYYERNGIEAVIVADNSTEQESILDYICTYPFINWKVVVNSEDHSERNLAKALNIGIRYASKKYVLVMDPTLEFYTDIIYELREKLDSYPFYYAMGRVLFLDVDEEVNERSLGKFRNEFTYYGCIMAKKEYFEEVAGYNEHIIEWDSKDDHIRKRLELAGIRRLFFPNAVAIHREDYSQQTVLSNDPCTRLPREVLSEILLPVNKIVNDENWGKSFNTVVYDWRNHSYAKQQCRTYLSTLKQFDILSDEVFEKSYPLIALIPTYNEAERITECLQSVEKHCDGIILLDDESTDNTYSIAQSDKLLVKAKKIRTEFNDKQNRNILLDIASFFKAEWFIFIDADERFDDRFVDLREVMKKPDVDTVGVWIANLWDSMETYRTDMEDTNPNSKNGLWFRWRMFRNKGRMQIHAHRVLHFPVIPYQNKGRCWSANTLLIHLGYLDVTRRLYKYQFYKIEDKEAILNYDMVLHNNCSTSLVRNIQI